VRERPSEIEFRNEVGDPGVIGLTRVLVMQGEAGGAAAAEIDRLAFDRREAELCNDLIRDETVNKNDAYNVTNDRNRGSDRHLYNRPHGAPQHYAADILSEISQGGSLGTAGGHCNAG